MKMITPYLIRFAAAAAILTLVFRYFLSKGIENESGTMILISTTAYALLMFFSGLYFGIKDGAYLPIYDVGFRFHFATFVMHNGISLLWIGLGFGAAKESFDNSVYSMLYWGIFLVLHFGFFIWARKNSINQLGKEDLFD